MNVNEILGYLLFDCPIYTFMKPKSHVLLDTGSFWSALDRLTTINAKIIASYMEFINI